jgi:hypothetical protein
MKKVAIAGLILIASMATRSSGWAQGEDSHQRVAPSARRRTVSLPSRARSPGHSPQHRQLCRVEHVQAAPRVSPPSALPRIPVHATRIKGLNSLIGRGTANAFITVDDSVG